MPKMFWQGKGPVTPRPVKISPDSLLLPPQSNGTTADSTEPENQLYFGDNFEILSSLLDTHRGKIDLVYIDPPFFTNRKFTARIGRGEDSRKPDQWKLTHGYADEWDSLDEYIDFLYQRLTIIHEMLADNGTIYLHLDWHADGYARMLLDEIFGEQNLLNEIIWTYHGPSPIRTAFNRKHDTILAYTKSQEYTFNVDAVRIPYNDNTVKTFTSSEKAGFGKMPDLLRGKVPEDWWYFPVVARLHNERTGYPTQKPEALLERIILASSNPGDLIADFFCGSGTTAVTAHRLSRRFITCDASYRSIETARERFARNHIPVTIFTAGHFSNPLSDLEPPLFSLTQNRLHLTQSAGVKYWEVDPDWDGVLFRSRMQFPIALRKDEICQVVEVELQENKKIAVRAILEDDRMVFQVFENGGYRGSNI